jgi:hypothetical protein
MGSRTLDCFMIREEDVSRVANGVASVHKPKSRTDDILHPSRALLSSGSFSSSPQVEISAFPETTCIGCDEVSQSE